MLSAIHFYHEHRFQTYEIEDVIFKGMLPAKCKMSDLFAAQAIPEKFLCIGLIFAKATLQFWLEDGLAGLASHGAALLLPIPTPTLPLKGREFDQAFNENFWKVWQSAGARPRLTANVQVTSLT
jgi:hypothetical protein